MVLQLLPSEIARLILNYLEDEKLAKTRETFLQECKYLEEYKSFARRGIKLLRTINGKTLCDYMVIHPKSSENELDSSRRASLGPVSTRSMAIQTDPISTCSVEIECDLMPIVEASQPINNTDLTSSSQFVEQPDVIFVPKTPNKESNHQDFDEPMEDNDDVAVTKSVVKRAHDSFQEEFSSAKKQKILIGRDVEKVPDFTISSVNRQIDSLLADSLKDIGEPSINQVAFGQPTVPMNHTMSSSQPNMMFIPPGGVVTTNQPTIAQSQSLIFDMLKPHSMIPSVLTTPAPTAPFFILQSPAACSPLPSMQSLMNATPSSITNLPEMKPCAPTPVSSLRIAPKPVLTEIQPQKISSKPPELPKKSYSQPSQPATILANTLMSIEPMTQTIIKDSNTKPIRKPSILRPPKNISKDNKVAPVIVTEPPQAPQPPPQPAPPAPPAPYSPIKGDIIFKDLNKEDNKKMIELLNKHNQAQASGVEVVKKKKYNRNRPTIRAIIDTNAEQTTNDGMSGGYQAVEIISCPDSNQGSRDVFDEISQSFDLACVKSVHDEGRRNERVEKTGGSIDYFKDDEASNTLDLSLEDICVKVTQSQQIMSNRSPKKSTNKAKPSSNQESSEDDDDDFELFSQLERKPAAAKPTVRTLRSRARK